MCLSKCACFVLYVFCVPCLAIGIAVAVAIAIAIAFSALCALGTHISLNQHENFTLRSQLIQNVVISSVEIAFFKIYVELLKCASKNAVRFFLKLVKTFNVFASQTTTHTHKHTLTQSMWQKYFIEMCPMCNIKLHSDCAVHTEFVCT